MNEGVENSIFDKVSASRAGREVSHDIVRAAVRWALERHGPKEAEKAARARLHQLYGSYVGEGWLKEARRVLSCLEHGELGGHDAAARLLALHGSTRERLAHIVECYGNFFAICGIPASVLDIACGLNPLSFYLVGRTDIRLAAQDAGSAVVETLNRFFAAAHMPDSAAQAGDALHDLPVGHFDLALVMKFLPLAERMDRGGALKLMNAINADYIVASFPTRSLSGRNVGMEKNYSSWFEGLGFDGEIRERFACGTEVFYVIKKRIV